jgi:hypothetical protein
MADRPMLFSAPMVRALLAGTKTQTRRVAKPQPITLGDAYSRSHSDDGAWLGEGCGNGRIPCPYGQPGAQLWVREAWTTHACFDHIRASELTTRSLHYQADGRIQTGRNRAAMHMPRWASRITLTITDVRVERLQDISEADAKAEGVEPGKYLGLDRAYARAYSDLWEQINGLGSWAASSWVWVLTFQTTKTR